MTNDSFKISDVHFADLSKSELNFFFAVMTRMHHLRMTNVVFNFDELTWLADDGDDTPFDTVLRDVVDHVRQTNSTYEDGQGGAKHDFFTKLEIDDDQHIVSISLNPDFEFLVKVEVKDAN
ncbi:RepB family plasmid replication initiator protein [Furfurilactobacillus sp. WILCCON 0119]|uniref:RepB family plasmid replication initiator protein n=1 Tax=Furfurilactobacillus entadae TaxID=2922307 RepID=UPI0035EF9A56